MAGISTRDGVQYGSEANNDYLPTNAPTCGPLTFYSNTGCAQRVDGDQINALQSEIACAVDSAGLAYDCTSTCNLYGAIDAIADSKVAASSADICGMTAATQAQIDAIDTSTDTMGICRGGTNVRASIDDVLGAAPASFGSTAETFTGNLSGGPATLVVTNPTLPLHFGLYLWNLDTSVTQNVLMTLSGSDPAVQFSIAFQIGVQDMSMSFWLRDIGANTFVLVSSDPENMPTVVANPPGTNGKHAYHDLAGTWTGSITLSGNATFTAYTLS